MAFCQTRVMVALMTEQELEAWRVQQQREELKAANAQRASADVKGLRPEVRAFAAAMEKQLRANDHKGGWQEEKVLWLLGRLREETDELSNALECRDCVLAEAADVANFAMMIADNCAVLALEHVPQCDDSTRAEAAEVKVRVLQELRTIKAQLREAREVARELAHAYYHDSDPPEWALDMARKWDPRGEVSP